MLTLKSLSLIAVIAPLIGGIIAGIFGKQIGRKGAHSLTILGVGLAFISSLLLFNAVILQQQPVFNGTIYTWGEIAHFFHFDIGFLIDQLTVTMMLIVTFVSLMVHIYSIGYMKEDSGYQRFFSYMSLFTFAMLMLVMANNFMQLFFGWEGVGLVSYLLIGFWFKKESAAIGGFKAFIVNRVGDLGFILAIAAIFTYCGSLNYDTVFPQIAALSAQTITIWPFHPWSLITVICILLLIGAMGKSAQMPLHVWLPESMEGPTPISALIHAATMVTAGIFMIARMSPLFEASITARMLVLWVGATTALFTGLVALVQFDIKRVVAYSTLSQLGYMMAALGASAYAAGIFHLLTHAAFKALLFLAAGSVIIAMHHEQDMRKMGGLWRRLPVTYTCFLIGGLALSAIPPFAGFYSKDLIIDAVHNAGLPGSEYAYFCVATGAFVTALYTFRAFFMTFHGSSKMSDEVKAHVHESPWVVLVPMILLAIPSAIAGFFLIKPMIFSQTPLLAHSIVEALPNGPLRSVAANFHGPLAMALHAWQSLPFWLSIAGIVIAFLCYSRYPELPAWFAQRFAILYRILMQKYGFDDFNQHVIVRGCNWLADRFYQLGDIKLIDESLVDGSGRFVSWMSRVARVMQSGYVYHYAFAMIFGLLVFLVWFVIR